ncbi:flagellar motor switch protein FliG [Photobacterium sp. R1]
MEMSKTETTNPADMQTLSSVDKTALVLLGMGEDAAAQVLRYFSREEVQRVTRSMAKLTGIKSENAKVVIQRFFDDFRAHSGIRGASKDYLSNTLSKALGNDLAKGVLNSIYGDELRNNMQRLQWVDTDVIAKFISQEHPQMQAIFLAYLPPETSSEVLAKLPSEQHDELIYRVARLNEIDHEIAQDLHQLIDRCIQQVSGGHGASVMGAKQAADIINRFEGDRAQLMEMLKLHDEKVVSEIEENMFDFVILARQREATMDRLVQEISIDMWATALKGADLKLQMAIKQSMPQRMANSLDDEMAMRGAMPLSRVEKARQEIMQIVRELADAGEIELSLYQEQTVE